MNKILIYFAIKYAGSWDLIYKALEEKEEINIPELEDSLLKIKSKCITLLDDEYPICFKTVEKPPFVIFYHGDISLLNNNNLVSAIGTRNNTKYGEICSYKLITELAKNYVTVSGMAKGIDTLVHKYTINNGGKTIAVLGSGINYIYPLNNVAIYKEIKEKGLIISEYPNVTVPEQKNFKERNRLIASLGKGLLVVEAALKSGTMNTVSHALNYGKDIWCVPHTMDKKSGCNFLIKQGAKLVDSVSDIIEDLN